jgi:HNH endonuclease
MATAQRKINRKLKALLVEKAGRKCANPGCSNWRVHIHHITHWAVYKTHDSADMIAICPSCHDAAHYGRLKITDEMLRKWKGIVRPILPDSVNIYVEPSSELKLMTGSVCIATTNDQVTVFELSNANCLKFRVLDGDLLQVSVRLQNQVGEELLRVVENHVRVVRNSSSAFDYRPGRARVTVPTDDFAPSWLIEQARSQAPDFAADGRIVAIDIEVLKPGLVRVRGCWPGGDVGVVITEEYLSFCSRRLHKPVLFAGEGEHSVLLWDGPITVAMFGFDPKMLT